MLDTTALALKMAQEQKALLGRPMYKLLKIVGITVGLIVVAWAVGIWLVMRTWVSDEATATFPPHTIEFNVWAESDGDIKGHWVYYFVKYGKGQQTPNERIDLKNQYSWTGRGVLTKYVSKDGRFFVARWLQTKDGNSFIIIFDNEQHASLVITTPLPIRWSESEKVQAWPFDWRYPYEKLRSECSFLPELER